MSFKFTDNIDKIIRTLENGTADAVDGTCKTIVKDAQKRVPVDTSELKQSIHAITEKSGGRSEAEAASEAANPGSTARFAPPAVIQVEEGIHQGIVDAPSDHAVYIENGVSSRPPRPFLEPAGNDAKPDLEKRMRGVVKKLERVG